MMLSPKYPIYITYNIFKYILVLEYSFANIFTHLPTLNIHIYLNIYLDEAFYYNIFKEDYSKYHLLRMYLFKIFLLTYYIIFKYILVIG